MGGKNRIAKDFPDAEFQKLMRDMDCGKVRGGLSEDFIRPAYWGTSICGMSQGRLGGRLHAKMPERSNGR